MCIVSLFAVARLHGDEHAAVVRSAEQPQHHLVNGPIYPSRAEEEQTFCIGALSSNPTGPGPTIDVRVRRQVCQEEAKLSPYPSLLLQKLGIDLSGRGVRNPRTGQVKLVPEYRQATSKLLNGVEVRGTQRKLLRFADVKKLVDQYNRVHWVPTPGAFAWGDQTKPCTDGGIEIGVTIDGPGGKGLCLGFYKLADNQFWRLAIDGVLRPPNQCTPPKGAEYLSTYDWTIDEAAGTQTVYGQAAPDATRIVLTTASGRKFVIDPFYVNSSLGINLYAARLPTTESIATYASFDANGSAIVSGGSPGICGISYG